MRTDWVLGSDDFVGEWVARQIPGIAGVKEFRPFTAIGLALDGELIAGCVFYNFRQGSFDIEIGFAATSPKWASRETIAGFLWYPFIQLGCNRITGIIAGDNKKAMRFAERLGLQREGLLREAMDGRKDAVIYGMLKRECKWLKKEWNHGEKAHA